MASSPVLVCTQQTVRDRHSVSVQLQGSYRGSWHLDTALQYYTISNITLTAHSRRVLTQSPTPDRRLGWGVKTLLSSHLTPVTSQSQSRRSRNKAPLVCGHCLLLTVSLDGMKGNFLKTEGGYLALWLVIGGYTTAYKTYSPDEDVLTTSSRQIIIFTSWYRLT